jgi:glycosyltransferase involved in cell wall biosynthesis
MADARAEAPDEPLVSVGIPTFNRAEKLARAAESVLGQTHENLELVISDNASTDGTRAMCEDLARRDSRVRYLRSDANRGPTANFNALFGEFAGDFAMLLSDDDWLDGDYLESCLAELRLRPELVLACGRGRYFRDGSVMSEGVLMQLGDPSPVRRVTTYLRDVDENGVFYGLMPRAVLLRAAPLRNVLGNDWLLAAAVAAQGAIVTITSAAINRELGGTSADFPRLAQTLGLPRWQARVPHLVIAWEVFSDVAWRAQAYRELSPLARMRLAVLAPFAAIRWRSLAWHLTMPTFAALGRRRGGGWLWRLYNRLTRRLGAGRDPRSAPP